MGASLGGGHGRLLEFFRYFVVSAAALAVDFALLVLLTEVARLHYLVSNVASFVAGSLIAYLGSIYWAFSRRALAVPAIEFSLFALIGVGGLAVNELALWLSAHALGAPYPAAKLAAAALSFLFNYAVRRTILFRGSERSGRTASAGTSRTEEGACGRPEFEFCIQNALACCNASHSAAAPRRSCV
jgi:putative flippase GtrA